MISRRTMLAGAATMLPALPALAASDDPKLDRAADAALKQLAASNPSGKVLGEKAVGILVFPRIVKVGFLLGGAYGEGALKKGGKYVGYYNSAAASYGLQAGAQWFGYALFFMNETALSYLDKSSGFEVGTGPSVVVLDQGAARKISSTTLTQDGYAVVFGQRGLMAGVGIEGSKITKIR